MKQPYLIRPAAEHGFLSIVAVLLIVVVGLLGLVVTYMIVGTASASNNFLQAENTLYIAQAGFEQAARRLLTPNLSGSNARIACASLTGNPNLTDTSFASGTFTASTVSGSPNYANTTLINALTSATNIIPVASTAGFAAAGRLMIEGEVINYGGISGNNFIGIQRGVNMTYNTPHASGAYVAQYQCNVDVRAGQPNLSAPRHQRETQQALQLQEAWAVGNVSGSNFTLTRWNRPTELKWTSNALLSVSAANLNSIAMLSNAEGWAVGDVVAAKFTLLHWLGSNWSAVTSPAACAGQNLTGVSAVYHQEAWAVGPTTKSNGSCTNGGTRRYTVLYWNGSSWMALTPTTTIPIPADNSNNKNLNAIHVIDATRSGKGNLGFAVGLSGTILQYNGSSWATVSSPTTQNLLDVYVVSSSEAWAVGAAGVIIKWNGVAWSTVSSPITTQLNSIAMLDSDLNGTANLGWAVGNSGVAVRYDGTIWSSNNTGSNANLLGVALFFTNPGQDVWAVGAGGATMHYDGSAWVNIASGAAQQLNAIAVIKPQPFAFAWQEIFP